MHAPSRLSSLAATLALAVVGCAGPQLASRGGPSRLWLGAMVLGALPTQGSLPTCGGQGVPPGWPQLSSSEQVLAPFLQCASPAEFIALQRTVDMARVVERLEDWAAVRLTALGPVDSRAAASLQRKRASFLVSATERYGPAYAEVFALFLLHSAHDDEVHQLLRLLAADRQLTQTLGLMQAAQAELAQRGIKLSDYPERGAQRGDVWRGLGRAAREALDSSPMADGARYLELSAWRSQLPPPYQQALAEVERSLALEHLAPPRVPLGVFTGDP